MRFLLLGVGACALLIACSSSPPVMQDKLAALDAPHQFNGRFFNPWEPFDPDYGAALAQLFKSNRYAGQDFGEVPKLEDAAAQLEAIDGDSVSWVGHATMMIRDAGDVVLTDPHLFDWALLVKRSNPPGFSIDELPNPKFGVISHNHYDHLDEQTVEALPAEMSWFVPLGLANWFRDLGRENVVELDWWESAQLGQWTVTCVPVQHWSRRLTQGTNKSLWCGWIMQSASRSYFFAGDTGYFHGFSEIFRRFGAVDVAMLPIGAHYPESFLAYQHMNPAQALQAFQDLQAKIMLPMHWGSFKLTLEPLAEPAANLRQQLERSGVPAEQVKILALGETWQQP